MGGQTGPLRPAAGRPGQEVGLDQAVEIPVEDTLGIPHLDVRTVILDELVRMEDVAPDLAPEASIGHLPALALELGFALLELVLGEAAPEDPHGRLAVGELRALVLALDDDAGREVRDADGRVGLVDVLAAGAARPVRV